MLDTGCLNRYWRLGWQIMIYLLWYSMRTSARMFFLKRFFLRIFRLHALSEFCGKTCDWRCAEHNHQSVCMLRTGCSDDTLDCKCHR